MLWLPSSPASGFRRKTMVTAYCVKCNKEVEIRYPVPVTVKGVRGINGICPVCGTRVFRPKRGQSNR